MCEYVVGGVSVCVWIKEAKKRRKYLVRRVEAKDEGLSLSFFLSLSLSLFLHFPPSFSLSLSFSPLGMSSSLPAAFLPCSHLINKPCPLSFISHAHPSIWRHMEGATVVVLFFMSAR